MSFVHELKRRNVFRVAIAYIALAWLLIEVAGAIFPGFGIPDWAFRFVVVLLALGFLPALLFSWAYELTPEGLKREKDVVRDASVTHLTARRLDVITIILVLGAFAIFAVDRLWLAPGSPSRDQSLSPSLGEETPLTREPAAEAGDPELSVAVLPFANRSADPEDVFFVDGIHDDLLTHIARIGAIKTISRTSVMRYRDSSKTIPEIAAELGVATVLEGAVQRAGDKVRINVQLIDARTDEHLWAEIYDRRLSTTNIFEIQTEIAESIAGALRATLSPMEEKQLRDIPTRSLSAYEAYLLGRQRLAHLTTESVVQAIGYFRKAVEEDPEYALAWVGLADAYIEANDLGARPREEALAGAQSALDTALALDPELGEAYTYLGALRYEQHDLEGAEKAYRRALVLSPNYPVLKQYYGLLLADQGRWDEALAFKAAAVELDPLSPEIRRTYAVSLREIGRTDEALYQLERALEIDPGFTQALDAIATIQWHIFNRHAESVRGAVRLIELDPGYSGSYVWLAQHYLDLGEPGRARRLVERAVQLAPRHELVSWGRLLLGIYQHDTEVVAKEAEAFLAHPFGSDWQHQVAAAALRDLALAAGRPDDALAVYSSRYPELVSDSGASIDLRNYRAAIDLALVLIRKGEAARANDLLDKATGFVAGQPRLGWWGGYWISDVQILALQGRPAESLAALRKAVDEGWRSLWWYYLPWDPNLESIRGNPAFESILADLRADLAGHMEQIRQMERNGEIGAVPGVGFDPD